MHVSQAGAVQQPEDQAWLSRGWADLPSQVPEDIHICWAHAGGEDRRG